MMVVECFSGVRQDDAWFAGPTIHRKLILKLARRSIGHPDSCESSCRDCRSPAKESGQKFLDQVESAFADRMATLSRMNAGREQHFISIDIATPARTRWLSNADLIRADDLLSTFAR